MNRPIRDLALEILRHGGQFLLALNLQPWTVDRLRHCHLTEPRSILSLTVNQLTERVGSAHCYNVQVALDNWLLRLGMSDDEISDFEKSLEVPVDELPPE